MPHLEVAECCSSLAVPLSENNVLYASVTYDRVKSVFLNLLL